ncbi:patatin-like phospholipase family protein [Pedobacter sp. SYSU D00535]|uniref:patatin-like phospholipase family protein n=1 Tax=Pedobacter sp. SYSU D00535 TaxID=2810308 RepID=UPI001A9642EA|nr:patatin-like phospholipase family protein [Pedobacter sp. SYSU D00535]
MNNDKIFHLGLCMAGSISAGAYTAGVLDYLHEALDNWEQARQDLSQKDSLPDHQVVIDVLGGASGGGITAALGFVGFQNAVPHAQLQEDRKTYTVNSEENIYWKVWVELTQDDILSELLSEQDVKEGYIPSLLNAGFVDEVAEKFRQYIETSSSKNPLPGYLNPRRELFLTLFNVTGIKYKITSLSNASRDQYISEHRDLGHFRWAHTYEGDGRIEVSGSNRKHLKVLLDCAKATGAFPIGLSARLVERQAKYIWDNPYFQKNGKFDRSTIILGKDITKDDDVYRTCNGDGGTANNEPVEFTRDLLLNMRTKQYGDIQPFVNLDKANETEKSIEKRKLKNTSTILIDPFPSHDFDLKAPTEDFAHLFKYVPKFLFSLSSQLIFDAKDAFDAYNIKNYGLHVIAPSRDNAERPEYAIACGSLNGFGGFCNKEFRIHDFFLGRHNCQSFLRKYFVVDLHEPNPENAQCVESVLKAYHDHPEAVKRFSYIDEAGRTQVPIIPDVTLKGKIKTEEKSNPDGSKTFRYIDPDPLPTYQLDMLKANYFSTYREQLKTRIRKIINSVMDGNGIVDFSINAAAKIFDDKIADKVLDLVIEDFRKRGLMR